MYALDRFPVEAWMPYGEELHALVTESIKRVMRVLPIAYDVRAVFTVLDTIRPFGFSSGYPDVVAILKDGSVLLVEVRNYGLGTSYRVEELISTLTAYVHDFESRYPNKGKPIPVLVIGSTLSHIQYAKLVKAGIALIDGPAMDVLEKRGRVVESGFVPDVEAPTEDSGTDEAARLILELAILSPGRAQWVAFQMLCGEILKYSFCPPLEQPLYELSTRSGVNRRDYIFPNYAASGFWEFVRDKYGADHVVVDAKNNAVPLRKDAVLQMANYLNEWGCGRFGILATRAGASRSGVETVREQWIMHRKMILVLDDGDITQMLEYKQNGNAPEELIRQKIEDFRLSF